MNGTTPEFDINSFNIGKNYVIEASAGTGKTYTIVEIVEKLLRNNITLDKMLIVTYTEKAAGELKDRIRTKIGEMGDDIKSKPENDVDNAPIGTIHSFCQNTLGEFFISAGKPSGRKLIDEGKIKDFLRKYIRTGKIYEDILEFKKMYPDNDIEEKLIKKLEAYTEKYYLDVNGKEDDSIVSFDANIKAQFDEAENNEYVKYLLANKTIHGCSDIDEKIECISKSKFDCKVKGKDETQPLSELADILKKSIDLQYTGYSVNKGMGKIGEEEIYNAVKDIDAIKKTIKNYLDNFINILVFKYTHDIYIAWQKEKENLCEQTYGDMIRDVREEVMREDGRLLEKLREKYTYAIIDEFQDTNRKQWDIFGKVFMSEGHNIIVVGDPKQSIYSFQGADLTVYEKAKEEIIASGGEFCSLKNNWRATKELIGLTNKFFDKTDNPDALPEDINFEGSAYGNTGLPVFKAEFDGRPLKSIMIAEGDDGGVIPTEEYAKVVCGKIADFCSKDENGRTRLQIWEKIGKNESRQRDVSFGDFAVLARTRSEMVPIKEAFEKYGIPYTQYKNERLFKEKECADWISILEAINAPDFTGYNRRLFKKAMFTYFFGYSLDDVRSPVFDKDSTDEIRIIDGWRELAAKREWAMLIERIFVDTDVFGKLSELGSLKTYGILMQIGDYSVDFLEKTDNPDLLVKNLRALAKDEGDDDDDSGIIAKSTDTDCVRVMTIHAAKGLQFPVVISAAGCKGEKSSDCYSYHDGGKYLLSFGDDDKSKKERVDEYKRLFYVAYTRPEFVLILPYFKDTKQFEFVKKSIENFKSKNPDEYEPLKPDSRDPERLKEQIKKIFDACAADGAKVGQAEIEGRIERLKELGKKVYFHTPQKHAYSSLSHGVKKSAADIDEKVPELSDDEKIENELIKHNNADDSERADGTDLSDYDKSAKVIACEYDGGKDPIELSPNFIAGTGIGNVLHRVFELIDYAGANPDIDELIKACFAEEKIRIRDESERRSGEDWVGDVKKMVENVTAAKLPIIKGGDACGGSFTLSEIGRADRKNEVEFNYNIPKEYGSHYMNGFVDLIFRRDEYYSILDWKSDKLSNDDFTSYSDGGMLKGHVDKLYSIQRVLYSYCLVKWLSEIYNMSENEVFEKHFGGIYYVFLRGCNEGCGNGVYAQTWENFGSLKEAYEKIVKDRV